MSDHKMLDLQHISKSYGTPDTPGYVPVLNGISLSINSNESVAIVGPSGSGKSTLLNIMGTLDLPTSGSVLLNGRDLTSLNQKELAYLRNLKIGFVFQTHHLLPQCSVLENVLLPILPRGKKCDRMAAHEKAQRLLEKVGLEHRIYHRPGQLSGGERQRVAVVRALINEPQIILADEPTGSLDAQAAENLGELLLSLNQEFKVALVVVTHSVSLASRLSKRYELRNCALLQDFNA